MYVDYAASCVRATGERITTEVGAEQLALFPERLAES